MRACRGRRPKGGGQLPIAEPLDSRAALHPAPDEPAESGVRVFHRPVLPDGPDHPVLVDLIGVVARARARGPTSPGRPTARTAAAGRLPAACGHHVAPGVERDLAAQKVCLLADAVLLPAGGEVFHLVPELAHPRQRPALGVELRQADLPRCLAAAVLADDLVNPAVQRPTQAEVVAVQRQDVAAVDRRHHPF